MSFMPRLTVEDFRGLSVPAYCNRTGTCVIRLYRSTGLLKPRESLDTAAEDASVVAAHTKNGSSVESVDRGRLLT